MDEKFFSLEQEKQDRILNAALKEFAQKGFKNASTNEIVKEAKISKGLIFHYFNNKKDLYLFLFDHFVQMLIDKMKREVDWEIKDIFDRHMEMSSVKIKMFHQYPHVFDYFNGIFFEEDPVIHLELEKRKNEFLSNNYKEMMGDIDTSKFREGIDVEKAKDIITWSLEGFSNKTQAKVKGMGLKEIGIEETILEMEEYLKVLKKSFYK
ncbi:TetR/AcrR family transcriptional regulator [Rossellomorea vietnamensis]|uniref:TetR/AcrR family transcriptional regulator n=1 Tax=Rossellomorea vietnamensis TaxID=218284 RepID=A0A5D4KAL3_9BACI|nr:TetR/AcrR family transcriptional regulator [Rossellomorea vietnamensis]TYR73929.1 TetR/AcrR family transcriptional regulator [Rossellomorea vietnamensis]